MIRDKLKEIGSDVYEFFSPSEPGRNIAGHAVVSFLFAYTWSLALDENAGLSAGISVYILKEIIDIGKEIRDDKEIDVGDHIKDLLGAFVGTAAGIGLSILTKLLVGKI